MNAERNRGVSAGDLQTAGMSYFKTPTAISICGLIQKLSISSSRTSATTLWRQIEMPARSLSISLKRGLMTIFRFFAYGPSAEGRRVTASDTDTVKTLV